MAEKEIPENATIEDVLPTLKSPEGYVRGVFGHLHECKAKHGNAFVRIGTSGRGLIPYYRVVCKHEGDENETVFNAFYGDNHNSFKTVEASNGTWSSAAMSYEEVQNLLGKIRGWKGTKR
jgi:hypothetical protein